MKYKILVIGELCIDKFVYGNVARINPEAPTPVFKPTHIKENSGMAGNCYRNVMGIGGDEVDAYFLFNKSEILKMRYVDNASGYILLRIDDRDEVDPLDIAEFDKILEHGPFDAVIISDYCKGFLTETMIKEISSYCYNNNILVFLDTKKILGPWSRNVSFVKINRKEFDEQLQYSDYPTDFCDNLIVTLGENGSKWINQDITVPTIKSEVLSLAGAGDSHLAAFTLKYLETKDIIAAMGFANRAASFAVSKQGVVAVHYDRITDIFS